MGGRSKSSQKTTHTQTTSNLVNDGTYAGATDVTVTEDSNNSTIEDSYNQHLEIEDSFNTSHNTEIDNEIDNSVNDSNNTDIRDSNNVDNRVDGDVYHGNVEFTDHGAIKEGADVAKEAIGELGDVTAAALRENTNVANNAFRFGEKAIDGVSDTAESAISDVTGFGISAIKEFTSGIEKASSGYSQAIENINKHQLTQNQETTQGLINSQQENLKVLSEVARNTSLQGQDLVAKSSEKIVLFVVGGVSLAVLVAGVVAITSKAK